MLIQSLANLHRNMSVVWSLECQSVLNKVSMAGITIYFHSSKHLMLTDNRNWDLVTFHFIICGIVHISQVILRRFITKRTMAVALMIFSVTERLILTLESGVLLDPDRVGFNREPPVAEHLCRASNSLPGLIQASTKQTEDPVSSNKRKVFLLEAPLQY